MLIKKVVDSKLFPPNADARGGISLRAFCSHRSLKPEEKDFGITLIECY